ncbi:hypothetical protein Cgig2_027551 [Carnegiea gigantea]|uniref:Phospholipase/carboxylesterase/thioesterase domain-containing protein n=1 Tax=Carnegiea gigantea TaxID=171969 RepID=A0A9Q1Q880_9CARY|nr:hypothetical protein Cgig2_027551 [Carnegiea gigantea]
MDPFGDDVEASVSGSACVGEAGGPLGLVSPGPILCPLPALYAAHWASWNGAHGSEDTTAPTPMTTFEFGGTHVVRPKGKHQATIVWLHGSDVGEITEYAPDDLEGLDASAAHIASLLSAEPPDVKLGIGGFNMGAVTALYSAMCQAVGRFANGNPYPINLSAIVGLSGWLPCSSTLRSWMEEASPEAQQRAAHLPVLLCHGLADDVVAYELGEKSVGALTSLGFQNLTFRSYEGLGHYTLPEETEEVCKWLTTTLELEGTADT